MKIILTKSTQGNILPYCTNENIFNKYDLYYGVWFDIERAYKYEKEIGSTELSYNQRRMYLGSYDFDCCENSKVYGKIAQHLKSAFTIFIDELSINNSPTDLVELRKKIEVKYTPAPCLADATIEYFIGDRKIQDINEFIQNTVYYGKGDSTLIYFYKTKNWTIFIDEDKVYILDQTFHIADIPSSLSIIPSDVCLTFKNSQDADKEKLLDWFKENHIAEGYKNEAIDEFKKATTNEIAKALGEQIKDLKSYREHREELFDIIETVITSNLTKVNKIAYDNNGHPLVSFETTKEEKSMFDNIFGKYEFGEVKDGAIKYTPNGLAMRDSCGDYVVYKDGTGTNMSNLTMDIPLFKMPVALADIKPGDIIVHFGAGNKAYVKVEEIKKDSIVCIDPFQKQRIELVPESNLFGFQFVVKVVSPISMDTIKPNESNPFGNLLPFMLMGKDNKNDDYFKYLMMMQMCGNTQFNPMMFMLMDKDGDNDFFKYMLMMQMGGIDIPTRPEVSE